MNVTATNHDEVSALLTVTLDKSDYKEKVEKQLINYAKKAQIPGFRKGKVPLSMVRKQYEAGIAFEEINKQVSEALNNYVKDNNLKIIGQPVPQPVETLDHNADQLSLDFEIGYEPEISVNLAKYEAPHFQVEASEKEIAKSIENMQKRFAEQIPQEKIGEDSQVALEISQVVEEDAHGAHNHPPKNIVIDKDKSAAFDLIKDLKMDESLKIKKEELQNNEELAKDLGFSKEETAHLHHDEIEIKVKDFYGLQLAELDQDLFDKVYGEGNITSEEELRARVKTELDEYFQQNADVHFVNKILEQLTEKEEVKLPEDFLVKWLMFSNENIKTEEEARKILEAEKPQLKFQIIENTLMTDHKIQLDYADVLAQAEQLVRNQLAMYGIHHLSEEEIQKYAAEMLKEEDQMRRISSEVGMAKLKDVILQKAQKKATPISHEDFLEEIKK